MNKNEEAKKVSPFPLGEINPYGKFFTGDSYLAILTQGSLHAANVTFAPGCRNHWHIHHKGGQILLVTGGVGYYQVWGGAPRRLVPGDVVEIPPEVKHWHGAAPDAWFSHIAIEVPAAGASNEWCEPVSEEEYSKLK